MNEYISLNKCKYCTNAFELSDGRFLCKKKPLLKSLIHPDKQICEKYRRQVKGR